MKFSDLPCYLVKQIGNYFPLFDVVNTGSNCWKPLVSWRSLCQLTNIMERHIILWHQHLSFLVLITTVFEMASVRDISSKNISAFSPNLQKQTSKETKKYILSILKCFRGTTVFPQFLQYEILRPTMLCSETNRQLFPYFWCCQQWY